MNTLQSPSIEELEAHLRQLPGWSLQITVTPDGSTRSELRKSYAFASFAQAVQFMQQAVPAIDELGHHPCWENVWRQVHVRLLTWDSGQRASWLDLELARLLDSQYTAFAGMA